MALTIHVSAQISDCKNSAYSLSPVNRTVTVTVIENQHLSSPSHTNRLLSQAEKWERFLVLASSTLPMWVALICPSRIKAFFSCPQDLKCPVGFAHSLLVDCAVSRAACLLLPDPGLDNQGNSQWLRHGNIAQCRSTNVNLQLSITIFRRLNLLELLQERIINLELLVTLTHYGKNLPENEANTKLYKL